MKLTLEQRSDADWLLRQVFVLDRHDRSEIYDIALEVFIATQLPDHLAKIRTDHPEILNLPFPMWAQLEREDFGEYLAGMAPGREPWDRMESLLWARSREKRRIKDTPTEAPPGPAPTPVDEGDVIPMWEVDPKGVAVNKYLLRAWGRLGGERGQSKHYFWAKENLPEHSGYEARRAWIRFHAGDLSDYILSEYSLGDKWKMHTPFKRVADVVQALKGKTHDEARDIIWLWGQNYREMFRSDGLNRPHSGTVEASVTRKITGLWKKGIVLTTWESNKGKVLTEFGSGRLSTGFFFPKSSAGLFIAASPEGMLSKEESSEDKTPKDGNEPATAQTPMSATPGCFRTRGCKIIFDYYEDRPGETYVAVDCWNAKDELFWTACVTWEAGDRVIDTVRHAMDTAKELGQYGVAAVEKSF